MIARLPSTLHSRVCLKYKICGLIIILRTVACYFYLELDSIRTSPELVILHIATGVNSHNFMTCLYPKILDTHMPPSRRD